MRQNQFQDNITFEDSITFNNGITFNDGSTVRALDAAPVELGNPTFGARLLARMFAAKFDRQVEEGAIPTPGSPLAAHIARLTSVREREHVARAFRRVLQSGERSQVAVDLRVPALPHRVNECRDMIDDITLRLHSPRPVEAKGMARLRLLLSDGTGPLYFEGQGSLAGQARGALAAL